MLVVAATAARFAIRPSELIGIEDRVLALAFDLAALVKLQENKPDGF